MIQYIFGERLKFNFEISLVTIGSTLLILTAYYWDIFPERHWEQLFLFLCLPLLIILLFFKGKPSEYGLTIGDYQLGLILTGAGILLMIPVLWVVGRISPEMQVYYQHPGPGFVWRTGIEMLGWEYLFRGWILFTYGKKYGPDAIWLQAVPFAIAHLTKPGIETISTIFGGFAFGWVAWRTKSFLYPFLIHWFISVWIIFIVRI